MPQETEQRRLSAVKSMQNIIDSIIYAMYTRENFEYCWGSCFRSYSEYSLYSIFTNALKQARRIQRDDFMMKMAAMKLGQGLYVGLGCFSPVQWLDEQSEASSSKRHMVNQMCLLHISIHSCSCVLGVP